MEDCVDSRRLPMCAPFRWWYGAQGRVGDGQLVGFFDVRALCWPTLKAEGVWSFCISITGVAPVSWAGDLAHTLQ